MPLSKEDRIKRGIILLKAGDNVSQAARRVGIHRATLRRRWIEYQAAQGKIIEIKGTSTQSIWLRNRADVARKKGKLQKTLTMEEVRALGNAAKAEKAASRPPCLGCGQNWSAVKYQAKGYCTTCYQHIYYEANK